MENKHIGRGRERGKVRGGGKRTQHVSDWKQ